MAPGRCGRDGERRARGGSHQLIAMAGTNPGPRRGEGDIGLGRRWPAAGCHVCPGRPNAGGGRLAAPLLQPLAAHPAERSRYNQMAKCGAEILPFGRGRGQHSRPRPDAGAGSGRLARGAGRRATPPGMVMGQTPMCASTVCCGGLDAGWLDLTCLPAPLRAHLLPLFEALAGARTGRARSGAP